MAKDDASSVRSDNTSHSSVPGRPNDLDVNLHAVGSDQNHEEQQELEHNETEAGVEEENSLAHGLATLEEELEKISVSSAPIVNVVPEVFDSADFPESYRLNSNREKLVLAYAENFRKQFVHLYRDRKPLLLNPQNELQVEKFVSTTIQPTELPFKDLYDWHGAASFVADYLSFVPLEPAHELPSRMLSPATILKLQHGNCFEYSTVLASLLIGAGYDAYVVSGYATKETCLMDETRDECPLIKPVAQVKQEVVKPQVNRYTVRPPKDLHSKFEMKMEQRRLKQIADEEEKLRKEEQERLRALEQPEEDLLYGLRVHSWVLILEGKREVSKGFFVEPLTGLSHPLDSPNYLGIESVWNHRNYWVNMQDCSEGVTKLKYDLGDCTNWEFMFLSNDRPQLTMAVDDEDDAAEQAPDENIEKHLDLPPSWTLPINITPQEFKTRCPQGKKTKLYKRAKLEKFAPYLLKDGLVCRLSVYADNELTKLNEVTELYENRVDKLKERHYDYLTEWITEQFGEGRVCNLKEHRYRLTGGLMPEGERTMTFYHAARVDGLEKRVETQTAMTEFYINRDDFLVYRHVVFGVRQKKFGPSENTLRPIELMIERYDRNKSKEANDDIAEVIFNMEEEKIYVTCHHENSKISATTREFVKPTATDDKGSGGIVWNVDNNYTAFLSDANKKDKRKVEIYQLMMDLLKAEERCTLLIRTSENEVNDILNSRTNEEVASELTVSIYDTQRNDKAKKHREMLERIERELEAQREERELDYLEPFLAKLSPEDYHPGAKLTRQQAFSLRQDCLADLKQRLIDRANLIQSRFEKETQELQKRQSWYQQNQVSMQKADEQEYLSYCNDAMFRIHILEQRLNRHKELAPHRYMALEQRIRSDPRLAEYF